MKCSLIRLAKLMILPIATASADPSSFEIQKNIAAKTDNADCAQLAKNMNESISAIGSAEKGSSASDAAMAGGMLLSVVPGAGLLSAALSGVGIAGKSGAVISGVEPQVLYEQSFQLYEARGCVPKAQFGESITGEVKEGGESDASLPAMNESAADCLANWSETGVLLKGQTFKTSFTVERSSKEQAYKGLMTYIASSGYQIGYNDAAIGIVSVTQPLRTSALTLNFILQEQPDKQCNLQATLSVPSGYGVKSIDAKKDFCGTLYKAVQPVPVN